MAKPRQDRLLQRGVWLLTVGIFTSWLFGIGLVFIFAAAVCGFVGLFRDRALQSALLLASSLVLGVFALHLAAVVGIYAFNKIKSSNGPAPIPASASPRY